MKLILVTLFGLATANAAMAQCDARTGVCSVPECQSTGNPIGPCVFEEPHAIGVWSGIETPGDKAMRICAEHAAAKTGISWSEICAQVAAKHDHREEEDYEEKDYNFLRAYVDGKVGK